MNVPSATLQGWVKMCFFFNKIKVMLYHKMSHQRGAYQTPRCCDVCVCISTRLLKTLAYIAGTEVQLMTNWKCV